jgi:hypothetical protein
MRVHRIGAAVRSLPVTTRLSDLLDHARHESFVGRRDELTAFERTLSGDSPIRVLFAYGPGGIGKTTLLLEFRDRGRRAGRPVLLIEGREVDPSPDGFRDAVARGVDALDGTVLLIDGYEQLAPIDAWLRNEFVPSLPADVVLVLAGREPPAAPWRTDPGWRRIVALLPMDHFDDAESRELLERAGVDHAIHAHLVTLGRGHPLAMAMLADVAASGTVPDTLADVPDLVTALLEYLLRDAPSEDHVTGLAACVKAWLTTEDLLRDLVGDAAPLVWSWLAERPFIACGPRGLFPHDLARDVLDAEFDRRIPERYKSVHRVVHDHVVAGLRTAAGLDRQLLAQHLIYLHRRSPFTRIFYDLRAQGSAAVVPARPDEHGAARAMVERTYGPTSAGLLDGWLAADPGRLNVIRTTEGLAGIAYRVIHPSGSMMEDRDAVVQAVLGYVARTGPLRPGEHIDIGRFFVGARSGGRDPYGVLGGAVSSLIDWVTRPLAWSFVVTIAEDFLGPYFEYLAFTRALEVEVDGLTHVAYGMDWRRCPVDPWLDLMNEREHSGGTGPPPPALLRPPPLDRAAFAAAVRGALADLHRADRLAANPLMGTALADTQVGQLRAVIEEAIDQLAREPKADVLSAVLTRTYVRAAPTQEAAAEVLGLPFSTYRRHLGRALEQLTDLLWAVEIGDIRLSAQRQPVSTD